MLTELCAELKNYFLKNGESDIYVGTYTIENWSIEALSFLQNGQYYRIVGSVFNDGVYCYPEARLTDETFVGAVWAMAVPPAVVALSSEIEMWIERNADVLASPYTSESFGGYSYTKATSGGGTNGVFTWRDQFASRLNKWRRLSVL